ncbi:hypothetical protein [Streptomyces sp. NPDC007984]|uniref:hypothetical protein n=1 Tax=Streptomyces sp. NPDC007984 TaxID=3364801 RepID=UPI0036E4B801
MPVNLDVTDATVTDAQGRVFRRMAPSGREGAKYDALRAVYRALQGDAEYVADGKADLDARGEISALDDRTRKQVVEALKGAGPEFGSLRPFTDAAARAIEAGPVKEAPRGKPSPVRKGRSSRGRRKAA